MCTESESAIAIGESMQYIYFKIGKKCCIHSGEKMKNKVYLNNEYCMVSCKHTHRDKWKI